jgi:hypothetical protein
VSPLFILNVIHLETAIYSCIDFKNDPKKYQHMLNAIKYSTSLWPLVVSAYDKTVESPAEKASLEKMLIVLLV